MTMKSGALILLLAVLVGIGGWYVFNHSQVGVSITTGGDKQIKENSPYYTIQVAYPSVTRLATRTDSTSAADNRAISTIEREMRTIVQQFKNTANQALTEDEKNRLEAASTTYTLNVSYHAYNSGSFSSYEFDVFEDIGGAHPSNSYMTLVFDLKGNLVSLSDLFSDASYLTKIPAGVTDPNHFVDDQGTLIFFTQATTSPEIRIPLADFGAIVKKRTQ